MANLTVTLDCGDVLDVRVFSVEEKLSAVFRVALTARSSNPDIDFDAVIGKKASFTMKAGSGPRTWTGVCDHIQQLHGVEDGLSTYRLSIVPELWFTTQRRNHRVRQQLSELEIVLAVLEEWRIEPTLKVDAAAYKKRKYKVQYAESDFDFINRLLEDSGITYYFQQAGEKTQLVLNDAPQSNSPRAMPLPYRDSPLTNRDAPHVTRVEVQQQVRPGRYTMQDQDYRKPPTYPLQSSAAGGLEAEALLEQFHYEPGAFLFRAASGGDSPTADDKGAARSDEKEAAAMAQRRFEATRAQGKRCTFTGNAFDLSAGMVVTFVDHPRSDLAPGKPWLIQQAVFNGTATGEWTVYCEAVSAEAPYRPPMKTAKPKVEGSESATVVGPKGEEIHCDEFGRVRVQFHWDRYGQRDDNSSCWMHVNQPWGGAGYGATNLPRVGQEVIVDFLGGDPDRPVIMGRVYTELQKSPYKLPANKTQSGWKSNSTGNTGGFNEIRFEDKCGSEEFHIQAEKDFTAYVKHDATTKIDNDRKVTVIGNNNEEIDKKESLTVKADRNVIVMQSQSHFVEKDIFVKSAEGNHITNVPKTFESTASTNRLVCWDSFEVECGASTIYMTPGFIIIESPKVLINPGAEALAQAKADGTLPKPQAVIEEEQQKAKDKAKNDYFQDKIKELEEIRKQQGLPVDSLEEKARVAAFLGGGKK